MNAPILQPIVVLVAWSLVMLIWMFVIRMAGAKYIPKDKTKTGMRGQDMEGLVPDWVQWPSHNYNHLMEQPTIFYAVALALAFAGAGDGLNAQLAWAYTGLRILHSLVQATFNAIGARFPLWAISSIVLMVLTVRALLLVF